MKLGCLHHEAQTQRHPIRSNYHPIPTMTMAPEINPCILRLPMLYPKEEETEANGDTVPRQQVPAQYDLTQLLSCSVKWVGTGIFLAQEAKAQRLRAW